MPRGEKCVLGKFHSHMSYSAMVYAFHVSEPKTYRNSCL